MQSAIGLGISNVRLEALNSRFRLISHRAHGFHSPDALIAMVYTYRAGAPIGLSHQVTPERAGEPQIR